MTAVSLPRRASAIVVFAVFAATFGGALSCWVAPWDPDGAYACDAGYSCLDGFSCVRGVCLDCDAGHDCRESCFAGDFYACGATPCSSNPCLADGGCEAPVLSTGQRCGAGVCRNDGQCVDAGSEFDCSNAADDNADGLFDCDDPSCLEVPCSLDRCVEAVCQAGGACDGPPKACTSIVGCTYNVGCDPVAGCLYAVYPVPGLLPCDDGNGCTEDDVCDGQGACIGGSPVTCPAPGLCGTGTGTCNPTTGACSYQVASTGSCDDGDSCTAGDRCDSTGNCSGTGYTCQSTQCTTGACLGDGGCAQTPLTGQPCTGGTCSSTGTCCPASTVRTYDYFDDLDGNRPSNASAYWTSGGPAVRITDDCRFQTATHAWRFGVDSDSCTGNYPNSSDVRLVLGGGGGTINGFTIPAPGSTTFIVATLTFRHAWRLQTASDGATLEYSTAGAAGPWTKLMNCSVSSSPCIASGGYNSGAGSTARWAGISSYPANGAFTQTVVNLNALAGGKVWLAWRYTSNSSINYEGHYLDDVRFAVDTTTLNCP